MKEDKIKNCTRVCIIGLFFHLLPACIYAIRLWSLYRRPLIDWNRGPFTIAVGSWDHDRYTHITRARRCSAIGGVSRWPVVFRARCRQKRPRSISGFVFWRARQNAIIITRYPVTTKVLIVDNELFCIFFFYFPFFCNSSELNIPMAPGLQCHFFVPWKASRRNSL